MPQTSQNLEDRIKNAIAFYQSNPDQKKKPIAREFAIPYQTFLGRLKGAQPRQNRRPNNYTLNKSQEEALKRWIDQLDKAQQAPTPDRITRAANAILRRNHTGPTPPRTVGKMWTYRFMDRLPDSYRPIMQKPMDPKRVQAEDISAKNTSINQSKEQIQTTPGRPAVHPPSQPLLQNRVPFHQLQSGHSLHQTHPFHASDPPTFSKVDKRTH